MNGEANCVLFHLDGKAFVTLLINMTESTGVIAGMITHRGQTNEGTQHFVATPSELEARWRAPAFTKDILRIVGIRKLDFSTPFHAIMLCPQLRCPHSYRGLLAYFVQTEHCIHASESHARECLKRLLKYNLTWGMLCPGMVFIPILAFGNYFTQRRSITRQMRAKMKSSANGVCK